MRSQLTVKTLILERLRAGEEATDDEAVEWHHRLNGHECEQTSEHSRIVVLQFMGSQRVRQNLVTEQQTAMLRGRKNSNVQRKKKYLKTTHLIRTYCLKYTKDT